MTAMAQQIAVVTGNSTKLCQTLADAIEEADPGSTIYLPGGGFQISDDVKITKKVSIIGIGHKPVSENVDGNTVIVGNLFFNGGSSNSVIMGCYISGNINIASDGSSVNNTLIRYCNLNSIQVNNNKCTGTIINQNYIRNGSNFNEAGALFTNNIAHSIFNLDGGIISNNVITSSYYYYGPQSFRYCDNCTISDNILIDRFYVGCGDNCVVSGNMRQGGDWGDNTINIGDTEWTDVFANYNNGAIDPASDFHLKGEYLQYPDCGIYGGPEPFSESSLPPVPYIISKFISEQTDASGKLNIKIRVKAGE